MNRFRIVAVGGAATLLLAGVGMASASNHGSAVATRSLTRAQVITQIQAAEARAAAAHNATALRALQNAEQAVASYKASDGQKGQPSDPPPPCPSTAPRAGLPQPCGFAYGFFKNHPTPQPCPSAAPNHGGKQPCGQPSPTPTGSSAPPPPPAACGPSDDGGSAAAGPISGVLYGVGDGLRNANASFDPLADLIQTIACAIYTNLPL